MKSEYTIALVGATGAVGQKVIEGLEDLSFKIKNLRPLASKRSAGKTIAFKGQAIVIEELVESSFENVDIAIFSAGGSVSKKFAPIAARAGAVVIDNTSAFRMDPDVPLVVPEVNEHALKHHKGIIANPNCSTIQMMVALEPIRQAFGLKRIIVSTYQAVSGAGLQAVKELEDQTKAYLNGEDLVANILPSSSDKKHYPIAFNALPQIDLFDQDGYTFEEWKMINESKKILEDPTLSVAATCVRIPVASGHSESVYIELEKAGITVKEIHQVLSNAPGVILQDDPSQQIYPTALTSIGKTETFVGRIRKDLDVVTGFHMWIVSDNLLKGAATNSIQIAESLIKLDLVHGAN